MSETRFTEEQVKALKAALTKAEQVLQRLADAVCGNEQINDHDTAQFYKGYNAVTLRNRNAAWEALPDIRVALSSLNKEGAGS